MSSWNDPWLLAALVPALLVLGALAHRAWSNHRTREQRRIPKHWPLSTRQLVNSEEIRVWHWLARAFYDHHIMIKLPVTRFTLPRDSEQSMHWYRLLGGVYCTFTICKTDGRVVGCLDVPGRNALPRSTRMLKHSLLRLLRCRLMAERKLACAAMMARSSASCSRMLWAVGVSPRNSARISATVGRLPERTTQ